MFYNIIPLLLILICGLIIIYIVTRKFAAVANLDLSTIPQEKEKRVRQRILQNRMKRNFSKWFLIVKKYVRPIKEKIITWIKLLYKKLHSLKDDYKKEAGSAIKNQVEELFREAEELKRKEEYEDAEKKYIRAVSLDSKNIEAFKLLGQLYLTMKKLEEAKGTFEHVLKLTEEDADIYAGLAEIAQDEGKLDKAKKNILQSIELNNTKSQNFYRLAEICQFSDNNKEALKYIKEALKVEPNNPKYLDMMLNLSIITKEKSDGLDAFKALKKINPENNKLDEYKEKIDEL